MRTRRFIIAAVISVLAIPALAAAQGRAVPRGGGRHVAPGPGPGHPGGGGAVAVPRSTYRPPYYPYYPNRYPYYGYRPYYGYPYYGPQYYAPDYGSGMVYPSEQQPETTNVNPGPGAPTQEPAYRNYCESAKAYYPKVTSCPEGWRFEPAPSQYPQRVPQSMQHASSLSAGCSVSVRL